MRTRSSKARRTLTCRPGTGTALDIVFKQQLSANGRSVPSRGVFWEAAVRRLSTVLEERHLNNAVLKGFNKAFACTWLDQSTVAFGTKDDKVVVLDADTLRVKKTVFLPLSGRQPGSNPHEVLQHCGIRSLELNVCGDLLAAAGCGPKEVAILSLPECQPMLRLRGHKDWVFGATWITDRVLATGSRDATLKLWNVSTEPGRQPQVLAPTATQQSNGQGKVRGVQWCVLQQELASVTSAAVPKLGLWDGELRAQRQMELRETTDVACLATDGNRLYAVGHVKGVYVIDPRARRAADELRLLESQGGIRSLQFQHGLLSAGNGIGKVLFYDLRKGSCMPVNASGVKRPAEPAAAAPACSSDEQPCLNLSNGWLFENELYRDYFAGEHIHQAAYAHKWDACSSRMLVVGGPLANGLVGSYVAMWR